jgi:hypothetical protein
MGFKFQERAVKYALREISLGVFRQSLSTVFQIDELFAVNLRRSPSTQAAIFFKYLVPATCRIAFCAPSIAR